MVLESRGFFMKDTIMYKEIYESVDKLQACYEYNKDLLKDIANTIKEFNPDNIIIDARGTSLHSGMYAKYLFELYFGVPVSFASPSVFTIYDKSLKTSKSLVIAISQSGKAKDITTVIEKCRKNGALTLGITNDLEQITAQACELNLYCNMDEAVAYAATKTFTSTMYLITKLVYELTKNEELNLENDKLISSLSSILNRQDEIASLADIFLTTEDIIALGRGTNLSLAMELGLKLRETINIHTSAYPISEFYHGPIMMVSPKRQVIVFAVDKHTYDDAKDILTKVKAMGATTLVITNNQELIASAGTGLYIENNDLYALFEAIIAMQVFVNGLANKRGKNPDFMAELEHIDTF